MPKIIITGGNGFIGKSLQYLLKQNDIEFNILTRNPKKENEYRWNIEDGYIDENVFNNATAIIHLAGENIGSKRWSSAQRKLIIDSRVNSTKLLYNFLSKQKHTINTFIGASGAGIYGDGKDTWQNEDTAAGNDFLADVCVAWESEAKKMQSLNIRTAILRTGIVLDKDYGVLPKIIQSTKYSIGTYFSDGKQYMPWIHLDDIIAIYLYTIQNNNISGIFNAVAPNPVSNKEFSDKISLKLEKHLPPIAVPSFALKIALGEMVIILLNSNRCSANKIINAGYQFKYINLDNALDNLLIQQ
ncbi:MAG: TIGR01777 family protein [Sphingobacteriales bacterium]|jgi:hypothetical protein|nr:MAG: TIGR01777 family protein [Sphingobacteriales bacterium]